jgi:hypothetical protein
MAATRGVAVQALATPRSAAVERVLDALAALIENWIKT